MCTISTMPDTISWKTWFKIRIQFTVPKKTATGTFTAIIFRVRKPPKTLLKIHRGGLQTSNLAYTLLLVQGWISQKIWLSMCLLAVLGSQGIVVKCTATIFIPYDGLPVCVFPSRLRAFSFFSQVLSRSRDSQSLLVHFSTLHNFTVAFRAWSEEKSTSARSLSSLCTMLRPLLAKQVLDVNRGKSH